MEGLTNLFQNPMFAKSIEGGTLAAGEVGNILEERKRLQYQNFVMDLLKNPQKLAAMAAKIQQPLNAGLTQSINNQVQGDMAQRGLSQAPGIFAASQSQALAPYYQQNQQTAMNAVMQSLGMPAGTFGKPQDLSSIMSMFTKAIPGATASAAPPGLTLPNNWTGGADTPPLFGGDTTAVG